MVFRQVNFCNRIERGEFLTRKFFNCRVKVMHEGKDYNSWQEHSQSEIELLQRRVIFKSSLRASN